MQLANICMLNMNCVFQIMNDLLDFLMYVLFLCAPSVLLQLMAIFIGISEHDAFKFIICFSPVLLSLFQPMGHFF